jgi:Protein of unknown function (DUF5131)
MSTTTQIEWTDATWNPVTGCSKITRGCDLCYAERFSERFRGVPGHSFENGFDLTLRPERLTQPLHWLKPRRIFVNSMSDLFHKEVPRPFIDSVFETMEAADWHTFQVLTKRSSLMARYLRSRYGSSLAPPHIWLGVSIEDAKNVVRLNHLHAAQVRLIRTSFGFGGRGRPHGNPLGHCWRRVWPACAAYGRSMGDRNSRPMPGRQGRILLQAMGRRPAKIRRALPSWARMEHVSHNSEGKTCRRSATGS